MSAFPSARASITAAILGILFAVTALPASAQVLLHKSNFTKLGSFRLPAGQHGSSTHANFGGSDSGQGLAFDAAANNGKGGLLMAGHLAQVMAEVSIPTLVNSTQISALNTAAMVQNFGDPMDGKLGNVDPDNEETKLGGALVHNNKIVVTGYVYYDGASNATSSHCMSGMSLATSNDAAGPFRIGSLNPGIVAGYVNAIPVQDRASFGGKDLFSGQSGLSVVGRTSSGPAAIAYSSADMGATNPVPSLNLLYYDLAHQRLGSAFTTVDCDPVRGRFSCFNGTTDLATLSAITVPGTRSILFFQPIGFGQVCYKNSVAGCDSDGGYGVVGGDRGTLVMAYSLDELLKVKNGTMQPWDVRPYDAWRHTEGFDQKPMIMGATYDAAAQVVYFAEQCADTDCMPVVTAFKVNFSGGGDSPPSAPSNLHVQAPS